MKLNVISVSTSLYNISPTFPIKSNGDPRFTLNLIPVNELFELIQYPHTVIEGVYPRA